MSHLSLILFPVSSWDAFMPCLLYAETTCFLCADSTCTLLSGFRATCLPSYPHHQYHLVMQLAKPKRRLINLLTMGWLSRVYLDFGNTAVCLTAHSFPLSCASDSSGLRQTLQTGPASLACTAAAGTAFQSASILGLYNKLACRVIIKLQSRNTPRPCLTWNK